MDMSLRATLPFWGVGLFTMLISICFCCFLKRLRSQGKAERDGYKTIMYSKLKRFNSETCAICIEEYKSRRESGDV
ncbi:hypothetical protein LSH36_508g02015 [Paralvinella palmiformis]|uniref:Uncharacterized protein n=1 Tax=Paralvinella palmiformis TaxID=53620 RepID=A0AAD9J9M3_9ANNE|nr:hypothetical protein LSH36_508g02015 [Paralvinella palmiformis]